MQWRHAPGLLYFPKRPPHARRVRTDGYPRRTYETHDDARDDAAAEPQRRRRLRSTAALVTLTDAAAAKVVELRSREGKSDAALRLFVKSGGCSGFSYGLAFDERIAEDDRLEAHGDVRDRDRCRSASSTWTAPRSTTSTR